MSEYTNNYNLIKPKKSENYDINDVTRTNADIIDATLHQKVDKIVGKGLSTNDFTTEYKKKIDTLQTLYRFKGTVENLEELNSKTNNNIGDVWSCKSDNNSYCWNKEEWINIGQNVDLDEITAKINEVDNKLDNLSKTYKGTSIAAPTVEGYGRILKLYGKTEEIGTGEKDPNNPYEVKCIGDNQVNIFNINDVVLGNIAIATGISSSGNLYITQNYIKVESNTTYTDNEDEILIRVFEYDSNKNLVKTYTQKEESFTTDATTQFIKLQKGTPFNENYKLQKGTTITDFSKYQEGNTRIVSKNEDNTNIKTIACKPLCCLKDNEGNIIAQDYIDFVKNIVHRECGYIVSYNNETISSNYISSTGTLSVGATVVYKLENSIEEDFICNDSLVQYKGETNIYNTDNAEMEVSLTQNKTISDINNNISNVKQKTIKLEKKINELTYSEDWKTLKSGIFYRKVGTDVEVRFDIENLNKTINGYQNTSFGMMPEGYRPKEPVRIAVFSINTIGVYPLHILINPTYYNGYINLYNPYSNNLTIKEVYGFVKYSIL